MSDQSHWVAFEQAKNKYMNEEEFIAKLKSDTEKWWWPFVSGYYAVERFVFGIPRHIGWWFQRRTRGFDDRDVWGLDAAIVEFVYPRLKMFNTWQKEHGNGTPMEFATDPAAWLEVLNKMEKAFEHLARDNFSCGFGVEDFPSVPMKSDFKDPADYEQAIKEWDRVTAQRTKEIETGLTLFGKHLQGLWD